jgi:soluble cytochrome b562
MKPRESKEKGFGVGKAGEVNPDGIELKLIDLGRDLISANKMKKEKDALDEMAYRIKAIAHVAEFLPPAKNKGMATKAKWAEYVKGMQESAVEFEKAVQTDSPSELKKAASKVNANCNNCHTIFK